MEDHCQNGMWGSIEIIDPNSPPPASNPNPDPIPDPTSPNSLSPYKNPTTKGPVVLETWKIILIAVGAMIFVIILFIVIKSGRFAINIHNASNVNSHNVNSNNHVNPSNVNYNTNSNNVNSNNVNSNLSNINTKGSNV